MSKSELQADSTLGYLIVSLWDRYKSNIDRLDGKKDELGGEDGFMRLLTETAAKASIWLNESVDFSNFGVVFDYECIDSKDNHSFDAALWHCIVNDEDLEPLLKAWVEANSDTGLLLKDISTKTELNRDHNFKP